MDQENLLQKDTIWSFYESDNEIEKYKRRINNFLLPIIKQREIHKILEVGCGNGRAAIRLKELGFDIYGIDPHFKDDISKQYPFLIKGSGLELPFEDNSFELSYSLEVIEHVGTIDGAISMSQDYYKSRQKFIKELCRISEKYIVIATPNRYFPIDEHGNPLRFHSPFEKFTLSLNDLAELFTENGFSQYQCLSGVNYYEFERIQKLFGNIGVSLSKILLKMAASKFLSKTPFVPHLFVMFIKG